MTTFQLMVRSALATSRGEHPSIGTPHHCFGVLLEEVFDVWDLVRAHGGPELRMKLIFGLAKVGAMAQRFAEDCLLVKCDEEIARLELNPTFQAWKEYVNNGRKGTSQEKEPATNEAKETNAHNARREWETHD